MKISEVILAWTPDCPEYPAGFRGKLRLFAAGTPEADLQLFTHRAGRGSPRAHDPRREVREAYAVGIATLMIDRDGLDFRAVHQAMLQVEEYATGSAPELLETRSQHSEEY